jgi:hypothetical protein
MGVFRSRENFCGAAPPWLHHPDLTDHHTLSSMTNYLHLHGATLLSLKVATQSKWILITLPTPPLHQTMYM